MDMNFPHADLDIGSSRGVSDFRTMLADILSRQIVSPTGKAVLALDDTDQNHMPDGYDEMERRIRYFAGHSLYAPTGAFLSDDK